MERVRIYNVRDDLPKKECLLLGIARIWGGRPLPKSFGPLFTKYLSLKLQFFTKVKILNTLRIAYLRIAYW